MKSGTKQNPITLWPADGHIPYGAYCKCGKCGIVARSTFTFDFYNRGEGEPMLCENCNHDTAIDHRVTDEVAERVLRQEEGYRK